MGKFRNFSADVEAFAGQCATECLCEEKFEIIGFPILSEYTVFNVAQCENLPDSIRAGKPMRVRNPDTRDELVDEFFRSTGADIREGYDEAYYLPGHDFISMPAFGAFKGGLAPKLLGEKSLQVASRLDFVAYSKGNLLTNHGAEAQHGRKAWIQASVYATETDIRSALI